MAVPVSHVRSDQRYAWRGPSLLIASQRGECGQADPLTGYYFREARHLSRMELLINGEAPWLCSDSSVTPDELALVYGYPEISEFGGGGTGMADGEYSKNHAGIQQRSIDIRLSHRVGLAGIETTITIGNRARDTAELKLSWLLEADFADIQEALSGKREQVAATACDELPDGLLIRYLHEQLAISTRVTVAGEAEWTMGQGRIDACVRLGPQAKVRLVLTTSAIDPAWTIDAAAANERLHVQSDWQRRLACIESPAGEGAVRTVTNAMRDLGSLAMLDGLPDEWLTVQAGIPMYPGVWGRDAITSGWQAAMFDQGQMIAAALTRLGRRQTARTNEWTDEQPGRIPFQMRSGPLERLNLNPFACSYADFASPLLFPIGLAHRFAWTADKLELKRHWDTVRRILEWARESGDRDGDGYLEYKSMSPMAPRNQGWRDSGDAMLYEDGTIVPVPLASCDLQGYWYAAQQMTSVLSWIMGEREDGRALWRSAADLKLRFARDWWMEDEGFIALALDPDKRQAKSLTSNVGQCLATGIVSDEHIPRVVGRLFSPELFSGWGIRTLSTDHPAYHPLGYHTGSVWQVENATTIFGLRRFGFDQRALELASAMFDLAESYDGRRVPECVGGYARGEFPQPGAYPRANPIQAWNLSGYAMILQSILGLQPVASLDLLVVDPVLPPWLPELILRDLKLAGATVTLRFCRKPDGTSYAEVLKKKGTFHLLHQPPLESLKTSTGDRFHALFDSILHH